MKRRDIEKMKKSIIAARNKIDKEARQKRLAPLWRRLLSGFFCCYGPERRWEERWEKKHEAKLRIATHNALAALKTGSRINQIKRRFIKGSQHGR